MAVTDSVSKNIGIRRKKSTSLTYVDRLKQSGPKSPKKSTKKLKRRKSKLDSPSVLELEQKQNYAEHALDDSFVKNGSYNEKELLITKLNPIQNLDGNGNGMETRLTTQENHSEYTITESCLPTPLASVSEKRLDTISPSLPQIESLPPLSPPPVSPPTCFQSKNFEDIYSPSHVSDTDTTSDMDRQVWDSIRTSLVENRLSRNVDTSDQSENESLRWEYAIGQPEQEDDRLSIYKINRRKRYIAQRQCPQLFPNSQFYPSTSRKYIHDDKTTAVGAVTKRKMSKTTSTRSLVSTSVLTKKMSELSVRPKTTKPMNKIGAKNLLTAKLQL